MWLNCCEQTAECVITPTNAHEASVSLFTGVIFIVCIFYWVDNKVLHYFSLVKKWISMCKAYAWGGRGDGWRTLCNSRAVNEFPVCLWNEREHCLVHLVPSKYLSKARHKEIIICHSTLIPPSPPPDVWTKTNRAGANAGRVCRKGIQRASIYIELPAVLLVSFTAV